MYNKNQDDIIQIDHLLFEYQREENKETVTAINDVSFSVKRGSFTAIIGRNGSGKSTLAKNINALLLPSGGAVYVNGYDTRDEEHLWDVRQSAGMVFQNPDNQLVSSIVEDDVAFGPENLGVEPDEIRRRVDESLKKVNMFQHRKRAPHHLSGGQKQRVAIAGVMAMRPECVILDEPTAMLDPKGRSQVMDIIHQLHEEGITIVLITHFMEEAAQADRIIIMDDGDVVLDGVPKDVFLHGGKIRDLYLDVPFAVEMAEHLRDHGMEIPTDIIDADGLVKFLTDNQVKISEHRSADGDGSEAVDKAETKEIVAEVKNLRHVFNAGLPFESVALDDVSFVLEKNSFTALIGHTGSGKSTLIQHLNGLLKPTSGSVCIDGADINGGQVKLRDVRKNVGLVFQYPEYQLFEETVLKDVCYGPLNLGLSQEEAEARAKKAIELVGLDFETVKDRSPFALSGGQKRRVAIAGVIAMEPEVLILDEPTAGLDPEGREDILANINDYRAAKNATIMMVSHSMTDVARLTDRLLVMSGSHLMMDGTPGKVFARAQELLDMGLDIPEITRLFMRLQELGLPVNQVYTVRQAVEELTRLKGGNVHA